jgi:hypothetical protein
VRIWNNVSTNTRIKVLLLSEFKRVIPRTVVMPFSKAGSFRYGALHSPVSPMIMYLNRYEYDIVYVVWCSSSNKMSLMDDRLTTALSSTQDRSGRYNSNKQALRYTTLVIASLLVRIRYSSIAAVFWFLFVCFWVIRGLFGRHFVRKYHEVLHYFDKLYVTINITSS